MRNLISGKEGNKVGTSVGYSKEQTHHEEGDIWEIDGRKWTIKNGIKQNITKLDKAKKAHRMPIFCPSCGSKMSTDFDTPYYKIHKKCFNCVVEFEHQLRTAGLYEIYENKIINSDLEGFIKDFKLFIEAELALTNNGFITEQGDVEKWVGAPDKEKVLEGIRQNY